MKPEFPIQDITLDAGTQMRAKIDESVVSQYAEHMEAGDVFPDVLLFHDKETKKHYLVKGFHRVAAHLKLGHKSVPAEVKAGTLHDAILEALRDNATHGLQRTNADIKKAISTMLQDPEWSQWSNTVIAQNLHVRQQRVAELRPKFKNAESPAVVESELEDTIKGIADGTIVKLDTPKRKHLRKGKVVERSTKPKEAPPFEKFNDEMTTFVKVLRGTARDINKVCQYNVALDTYKTQWARDISPVLAKQVIEIALKIENNLPAILLEDGKSFVVEAKAKAYREKQKLDAAKEKEKAEVKKESSNKETDLRKQHRDRTKELVATGLKRNKAYDQAAKELGISRHKLNAVIVSKNTPRRTLETATAQ